MKLKSTGSFCKKAQIVKPTNLIIYTEREVVLGQPREASWRQTNITRKLLWSVEITSRGAEIEKRRDKKDATLS